MKPPFAYYGGKTLIADRVVTLLPAHKHYVEPFAGGLSVLLAKPPSLLETVNDLDRRLVTFWRVLRDRPDDLARVCALTPHSRAELDDTAREPAGDDLEDARRLWVLLTQAQNPAHPTWRRHVKATVGLSIPAYLERYAGRIVSVAARLAHVSLECRPALQVVADYGAEPTVLLYVDPPYLATARNSNHYLVDMGGEAEHRELAEALLSCHAAVVLSGYDSPLYRELYAGWDRVAIETATARAAGDRSRTEVLWSNRPLGGSVQPDMFAEELSAGTAVEGGGAAV